MEQQFTYDVLTKLRRKKRKRIWKRIVSVMMCLVVFCTTYMLILPAITKEKKLYCGLEEHTHEVACYQDKLICTSETDPDHIHAESCYEQEAICGKVKHTHSQKKTVKW